MDNPPPGKDYLDDEVLYYIQDKSLFSAMFFI